jgi:hypothetical protein
MLRLFAGLLLCVLWAEGATRCDGTWEFIGGSSPAATVVGAGGRLAMPSPATTAAGFLHTGSIPLPEAFVPAPWTISSGAEGLRSHLARLSAH